MARTSVALCLIVSTLLIASVSRAADARQQLIGLEQEMIDALSRSDVEAVDALWADELVWVGLNGTRYSKAERLAGMKATSGTSLVARNKNIDVRIYGTTAVVIVLSTWTTPAGGEGSASDYIATHIWSHRLGRWRLVAAHISKLARKS